MSKIVNTCYTVTFNLKELMPDGYEPEDLIKQIKLDLDDLHYSNINVTIDCIEELGQKE